MRDGDLVILTTGGIAGEEGEGLCGNSNGLLNLNAFTNSVIIISSFFV